MQRCERRVRRCGQRGVYGAFVTAHDSTSPVEAAPVLVDDVDDGIVTITLNRPDRLNAMDRTLIDGLHRALGELDARDDVRAASLTGAGRSATSSSRRRHHT